MSSSFELSLRLAAIALDGSSDDSPAFPEERNAHHRWTDSQRKYLCVLRRWFLVKDKQTLREISSRELRDTFVQTFAQELPLGTNGRRISPGAISSQLYEIFRDGKKSRPWRETFLDTKFRHPFLGCAKEMTAISNASSSLRLNLILRAQDNVITAANGQLKRDFETQLAENMDSTKENSAPFVDLNGTIGKASVVVPSSQSFSIGREPLVERSKASAVSLLTKLQPRKGGNLVFRFYDDDSHGIRDKDGFRALAFAASPVPGVETNYEAFQALAFVHLRPVRHPSHFISLFSNFRPALHRALRSRANPRIAVISLAYLIENPIEGRPRVFNGRDIAQNFGIKGYCWNRENEYNYTYKYEYLAWGKIESEAIVADFAIDTFRDLVAQRPAMGHVLSINVFEHAKNSNGYIPALKRAQVSKIDKATGIEVGSFLAFIGLPATLLQDFASRLAQSWCFTPINSRQSESRFYLERVQQGFDTFIQEQEKFMPDDITEDTSLAIHVRFEEPRADSPDTLVGDDFFQLDALDIREESLHDDDMYIRAQLLQNTEHSQVPNSAISKRDFATQRKYSRKGHGRMLPPLSDSDDVRAINDTTKTRRIRPKTKAPAHLSQGFTSLQLRGTHSRPMAIDNDASESGFDPAPFPSTVEGTIEDAVPEPKPAPAHAFLPAPAVPSAPATAARTYEIDSFMARRLEINEALGTRAETRPDEWRGWREEWKGSGVV
ncbi:MAG: hypothetical protein LQ340_004701 [Diploschistes diacapsis]|nr:MAG: hypothetical protein LQ340_004701 [Diploschistes diacapsis]